jgi:lipopolysaccharide transport system ATP-binding protein
MAGPAVVFDRVSKKFRRGERHDSLRDLMPSLARRALGRMPGELEEQEFWALKDVSFEVPHGGALGIIGANGAGKSTALKLLTKILKPTSGAARVHGRVGALIEVAAGFHPDLTGRENILLQGAIMGMKRQEIQRRFDEIVEFAGVSDFIDTPVKRYSSGMNARLGFSIAAHLDPDVLIIDEVLSVGDMAFQSRCMERMRSIRRRGVTILFVSHNLTSIQALCDQTLLLDHGHPVFDGPTSEALALYVASSGGTRPKDATLPGTTTARVVDVAAPGNRPLLDLRPGERVHLTLEVVSPHPPDQLVLMCEVEQLTSGLLVNHSNFAFTREYSTSHRSFRFNIGMTLNLLRGFYSISFAVRYSPTQDDLVWLRPAVTVSIHESTSRVGVVDLDFQVSPVSAAGASLHPAGECSTATTAPVYVR